jgi:hypothetical protein
MSICGSFEARRQLIQEIPLPANADECRRAVFSFFAGHISPKQTRELGEDPMLPNTCVCDWLASPDRFTKPRDQWYNDRTQLTITPAVAWHLKGPRLPY